MNRSANHVARITGLATAAALTCSPAALSQTVDFEDVAIPSGTDLNVLPEVESGGYSFHSMSHLYLLNDLPSMMGSNGSTVLRGWLSPVSMMALDGSTMDLVSMDLCESGGGIFGASTVVVRGYYEDGSSITMNVALDQITDGLGGADDFQTVEFDAAWSGLAEIVLSGLGAGPLNMQYLVDNIVIGGGITDSDGDGVGDDVDACPYSDMRPTLYVGDFNTGVANALFINGCTMADEMSMLLGEDHPAWFIWKLLGTVRDWRSDGLMSRWQSQLVMLVALKEWHELHRPKPPKETKDKKSRRW